MARTYNIACHDCLKRLWVGQNQPGGGDPYWYGTDEDRNAQIAFFVQHTGHRLEFNDSEHFDYLEFDDVTP